MKLASYKATRPGLFGVFNRAVRWWLHGAYSHCEIVFDDGVAFSCSKLDGGPRLKAITFSADKWDIIPISDRYDSQRVHEMAEAIVTDQGPTRMRYSVLLLACFVIPPLRRFLNNRDEVCSTACALILGRSDYRWLDPNELHDVLSQETK